MSCNKTNSAVITPVVALGSSASPYFVQVNISQRLCTPVCVDQVPVFAPRYSYAGIAQVAAGQYVITIHVEGIISYNPCGSNGCCSRQQNVSQDFTIPLASATAPTSVTIVQGSSVNAIHASGCQNCSREFVSETPLTITVA
jgi:hypothetical protein